jgi:hypothetical protein
LASLRPPAKSLRADTLSLVLLLMLADLSIVRWYFRHKMTPAGCWFVQCRTHKDAPNCAVGPAQECRGLGRYLPLMPIQSRVILEVSVTYAFFLKRGTV